MVKIAAGLAIALAIFACVLAYTLHLQHEAKLRKAFREHEAQLSERYLNAINRIIKELDERPIDPAEADIDLALQRVERLVREHIQRMNRSQSRTAAGPPSSSTPAPNSPMLDAFPIANSDRMPREPGQNGDSSADAGQLVKALQDSPRLLSSAVPKSETEALQDGVVGRIAYVARSGGSSEIFLIDSDGGNKVRLTTNASEERFPAWSPDGQSLVYASDEGGSWDLYSIDVQTHTQRRLTRTSTQEFWPAWSPDGEWIAYATNDEIPSVYLIDSRDPRRPVRIAEGVAPCWSPDGSKLVFQRQTEMYQIDADGTDEVKVLPNSPDLIAIMPRYSPDGKRIVFSASPTPAAGQRSELAVDVWMYEFGSAEPVQLTHSRDHEFALDWSADGQEIVHYAIRNGKGLIRALHVASGTVRTITSADSDSPWAAWRRTVKPLASPRTSDTAQR